MVLSSGFPSAPGGYSRRGRGLSGIASTDAQGFHARVISAAAIQRLKLGPEDLKKRFDLSADGGVGEKEQKLINRWRARAQAGMDWNWRQHQVYLAIDRAWDAGFYQSTQTLIGFIKDLSQSKNEAEAITVAKRWQMTHLLSPDRDPKTGAPTGKTSLSLPVFFEIILSLARSYTLMRVGRLAQERRQVPLFKYEPAIPSPEDRARTELLNARVDRMAREFGYGAVQDQAIQYTGMYGHQLMFPGEEWYVENGLDTGDKPKVQREGLRYELPHPSRSYFDLDFPLRTFNDDSGCRYGGYWRVTTWGSLRSQASWWNLDKVKAGSNSRLENSDWNLFFQTTGQCRMAGGTCGTGGPTQAAFSPLDRQKLIDSQFYGVSNDCDDQPCWVTEHFEKVNLKRDLDDKLPDVTVWMRVVLAGDDTPLYVAVLPARPVTAWLWEPVDGRAVQQGMVMDVMPYQDHASNIVSQGILSLEQNLANVTLYDSDIVDPQDVDRDLRNPNRALYRRLNFWSFSGRKIQRQEGGLDGAFRTFRFPLANLGDHLGMLNQLLGLCERVIGMSAQELGGTASHEQSSKEIQVLHQSTAARVETIGANLDRAIAAWKEQIAAYLFQFGTLEAYKEMNPEWDEAFVKKLGFRIEGGKVHAPLDKIQVDTFVSDRDGPSRVRWQEVGNQMATLAGAVGRSVPPEQVVPLLNMALEAMQLPPDFRLKETQPPPSSSDDIKEWVVEQFKQLAPQIKDYVARSIEESVPAVRPPIPMPSLSG